MAQAYLEIEGSGNSIPVPIGRARMQRLAKHWHYVMRSRRRWVGDPDLACIVENRAARHLEAIGVKADDLQAIADAGVVQVRVEDSAPLTLLPTPSDTGWEARLIPWEYLLCAATRKYRNRPLVVVRYLAGLTPNPPPPPQQGNALFIQSAPGPLRGTYTFDIEMRALKNHLEPDYQLIPLEDPTLSSIALATAESPTIIHLSAFDNYQGARVIDPKQKQVEPEKIRDGMYLRDEKWSAIPVDAFAIAQALNSGATKPAIVSFNLYNSSARLAAFTVAGGAGISLGFQDFVDDRLAEVFFANFYWYWRSLNRQPLPAFERTMLELSEYNDKLQGTGIVLWSSQPLVGPLAVPQPKAQAPSKPTIVTTAPNGFETDIRPHSRLNYSLLHNSKNPLFETFSIYKSQPGPVQDIEVEVELQIGAERFPYKRTVEMRHHVLELCNEIGVGLTSDLTRSLRESVKATLFVRVTVPSKQLFCRTFPITLLPIDEWKDDGLNHIWLPSFVLPRDPAVLELIVKAQRFLMALRDDAFVGFDGYQSIEGENPDVDAVDAQVRSLWYAILHDNSLDYINPPPSFTDASQRLRTPSDTLLGGRGTCIDLALLVAACLEFIDIKPAIILLNGHAFPAYWSSEESRTRFLVSPSPPLMELPDQMTPLPDEEEEQAETESFVQRVPWEFDKSRYVEVFEAVENGDLVPIESTMLTNKGSFWDAIDEGIKNLQDQNEFYSMLDIRMARDHGVTPLPLAPGVRSHNERR
jgi:hypothetical protein